mgnify:CR=1 FL=1
MATIRSVQIDLGRPTRPYRKMPAGLYGYWWETERGICVPLIASYHQGDGTFSTFLNTLRQKRKTIFFPTVVSARLDAILRAKGFIDCWVKGNVERIDGLGLLCCPACGCERPDDERVMAGGACTDCKYGMGTHEH